MKKFMMNVIRRNCTWAVASLLVLTTVAGLSEAKAQGVASADVKLTSVGMLKETLRPQGVPSNFVVTPNGYFSPECVQTVHSGETLNVDGTIAQSKGALRKPALCTQAHYAMNGAKVEVDGKTSAQVKSANPSISGWVESTNYESGTNIGRIVASWTVPSNPSNVGNQIVYFFPGLEQLPNVVSILQPVLGWNGYNDHAWTMASWNCCVSGTTYHSDPINVSAGDGIVGDTHSTCAAGTQNCGTWAIVSKDLHTGQSTTLNTNPQGSLTWVFGSVLEAYGIDTCDQYPQNGLINSYDIGVYDINQTQIASPPWNSANASGSLTPQCSYSIYSAPYGATLYF
ncbi:hypothetical protein [Paraburkholderia acidicola]|nr:hypothetical protein [Paraburkholderia acidicola]